jgi:hypothetical protein
VVVALADIAETAALVAIALLVAPVLAGEVGAVVLGSSLLHQILHLAAAAEVVLAFTDKAQTVVAGHT